MITQLLLQRAATPIDFAARGRRRRRGARGAAAARAAREFDDGPRRARAIYPVREDNTIIVGDRPLALLRRWMLEVADRLVARGAIPSRCRRGLPHRRRAASGDRRRRPSSDLTDRIVRRRGEEAWVRANPGPLYVGEQGTAARHLPPAQRRCARSTSRSCG